MVKIYSNFILLTFFFSIGFAQEQEFDADALLEDSIRTLDIAGVKKAIEKGANPNRIVAKRNSFHLDNASIEDANSILGQLALSSNVNSEEDKGVEILEFLFKSGAKLEHYDDWILNNPIVRGWVKFTETLLKNGASPTQEIFGKTPMELAVIHEQPQIIELLKEYGAIPLNREQIIQLQLFYYAGINIKLSIVEESIKKGVQINKPDRHGRTVLVNATSSLMSLNDSGTNVILFLLEHGADPTIFGQTPNGNTTALHSCVLEIIKKNKWDYEGYPKAEIIKNVKLIIKSLIRHGADVSARDSNGDTPLHLAARNNIPFVAEILLDAGADIFTKNNDKKTPLAYAMDTKNNDLVKLFLRQVVPEIKN